MHMVANNPILRRSAATMPADGPGTHLVERPHSRNNTVLPCGSVGVSDLLRYLHGEPEASCLCIHHHEVSAPVHCSEAREQVSPHIGGRAEPADCISAAIVHHGRHAHRRRSAANHQRARPAPTLSARSASPSDGVQGDSEVMISRGLKSSF